MHEKTLEMIDRTKRFALRVVRLVDQLPKTRSADVLGRQVLRSATSVGANYRAAQRGRSKAEFIAKLGIVEEEADETCYWLELITDLKLVKPERLSDLLQESQEILAIIVSSIRSARSRSSKQS